jgi:hypothetical protein
MLNLFKVLGKLLHRSRPERRRHARHYSFAKVDYLVHGSWYNGSLQNISKGGLYIRSTEKGDFSKGDSILMLVEFGVLSHEIRGKITRVELNGIAIEFETSESG